MRRYGRRYSIFPWKIDGYPADIRLKDLTDEDIAFLDNNMDEFLESIGRTELRSELSDWQQWHKLEPLTFAENKLLLINNQI